MKDPLRRHSQHAKTEILGAFAASLAQSLLTIATPLPLMFLFDRMIGSGFGSQGGWLTPSLIQQAARFDISVIEAELYALGGLFVFAALLANLLARLEESKILTASRKIVSHWRRDLLARLLHGKLTYFATHSAEDLAARVTEDMLATESVLEVTLRAIGGALPTLLMMLAILATLELRLAIVFAVVVVPFYLIASSLDRRASVFGRRSQLEADHFQENVRKTLARLPGVKALALEEAALENLAMRADRADEYAAASHSAQGALTGAIAATKNLLRATIVVGGGWLVSQNELSLGYLILFFWYNEVMDVPATCLSRLPARLRTATPALERLRALELSLENEEETEGAQSTTSLPFPDAGLLRFEQVQLDAADETPFTAEFEPGELIAVVGQTDSGKTAFGRLLNRLNEPVAGRIFLGRNELRRFRLKTLRSTVTVVERTPYFVPVSIRENLELVSSEGEADVDHQKLNQALYTASVDFLGELPDKIETSMEEGRLNASETFRLQLARALLRGESRVYYFNEPVGLEAHELRDAFDSIQELAEKSAIVFWATRQIDEAKESDRVLFMQKGKTPVLETHEHLLLHSEPYRRFFGLRERKVVRQPRNKPFDRSVTLTDNP